MATTSSMAAPEMSELEGLAHAFQEQMYEKKLIQDRKYKLRTYTNVFLGSDAVTVLKEILQAKAAKKITVDRHEAKELGREIASHFQFFCHVHSDHELKDEDLFYRFQNNLPSQVAKATQNMRLWDTMNLWEKNVDVQDRTYRLRSYPQCFVGCEAVDVLMNLKLVISRDDAVRLVREMNRQYDCCEHVCRDHTFLDEYLFYRFIPKAHRMIDSNDEGQMLEAMLDTFEKSDEISAASNSGLFNGPDRALLSLDDMELEEYVNARSPLGSVPEASTFLPPGKTLKDIADALERDLDVRNRRYRFTVYEDVFIAGDAVTYMVKEKLALNRSSAELLGQLLEEQMNLFHHVTKAHKFRDKYYFFRFTARNERKEPPGLSSTKGQLERNDWIQMGSLALEDQPSRQELGNRHVTQQMIVANLQKTKTTLDDVARAFETGVGTKDMVYRMKTYKDVFTGLEAVDFLVKQGFAYDRRGAVLLGKMLAEEHFLFEHVTRKHQLVDASFFYRFIPSEERKDRQKIREQPESIDGTTQLSQVAHDKTVQEAEKYDDSAWQKNVDSALLDIYFLFRQGVKVKNNRYHGKTYKNTFIGSEGVSFLVNSNLAPCRKSAVQLGRRLMNETKQFDHVTSKWEFSDDYKFYIFKEDKKAGQGATQSGSSFSSLPQSAFYGASPSSSTGLASGSQTSYLSADAEVPSLDEIAQHFIGKVPVQDRRYYFTNYKDIFVGSDAVDVLVATPWVESRREAVQLGQSLMRELDLFQHVTKAHDFKDEMLFYKFTDPDKESLLRRIGRANQNLGQISIDGASNITRLIQAAQALEEGLTPSDNRYNLRLYKATIVGSDIVSLLLDNGIVSSRAEGLQVGRDVAKHFQLFEHVTLEHRLKDQRLFYRFVKRHNRSRGQWFKNIHGDKIKDRMLSIGASERVTVEEYWQLVYDMMENDICEFELEKDEANIRKYDVFSDDTGWNRRVSAFELRISKSIRNSKVFAGILLPGNVSKVNRMKIWSSTFLRLDPRFQILHFFNEIAQTGVSLKPIKSIVEDPFEASVRVLTLEDLRPLLRFLPVNLAQVFTVWRPTSFDAIKKMMLGEAVGKGLDIKGKSAKRGKLSGFVPFLQIDDNKDKRRVRRLSRDSVVRVFYSSTCRSARNNAAAELERVCQEMIRTVEEAKKVLASEGGDSLRVQDALECMLLDMADPCITFIDDYAPERYGLEIPERLFWEAYIVLQDCTRKPGTIYDIGRPSQPAFQDMNIAALRAPSPVGVPKAVVYQNAERDDPMNPFELLMAYEENGRVLPVVSDFDCFLVGTRRVQYDLPLPPDQVKMLEWLVSQIENIVEKSIANYGKQKKQKPWSLIWLEVLKKTSNEGFHPEIPKYGFGDPKSYSIMENAVERLNMSGAVRHGAECFNYYFPQELDENFLVISEGLGNGKHAWKYVDADELFNILSVKIDEGYTLPLNPKWILMDGWKPLYDKLLKSENENVQQSMGVWFPPETGLRKQIERIHELQEQLQKLEREANNYVI